MIGANTIRVMALLLIVCVVFLAMTATGIAQDSSSIVHLARCDSVTIANYVRTVFGDKLRRHILTDSERACSTAVLLGERIGCLNAWRSQCGLLNVPGESSPSPVWFFARCDTIAEKSCPCCIVPAGGVDFTAIVFHAHSDGSVAPIVLRVDSLLFPSGSHQSGNNLPQVISLELHPDSLSNDHVLALLLEDNSVGNHPHSDTREGFWLWTGDSLQWCGSIWREMSTVSGAESSRGFQSTSVFRRLATGRAAIDYSREFGAEEGVWYGRVRDICPIVLALDRPSPRVLGMRITADSILQLRNSLPMLVTERLFVDESDPSCPVDVVVSPLFRQASFGEPNVDPRTTSGLSGYSVRQLLRGAIAPSMVSWVEGDSIAFSFCMPDNRKVALWFDPDLRWNYADTAISGDERVYVVHPHERSSPFRVEGYQVSRSPMGMSFTLVDSGEGRFRWFNEGLEVTVRISRAQIGFQTVDSLAVCGFGMQALWWEYDRPDDHPFEQAPPGFNREKPSTWGNLVLGRRDDYVNERRLWRYLELMESRGR